MSITERMALPSPYSSVTVTYRGKHNFIVSVDYVDSYGIMTQDTLVNAIGNYQGTVFVTSEEPVMFEVLADKGTWEGRIEGLGRTKEVSWDGTGDWVSPFFEAPKRGSWRITHGSSNFMVKTYCVGDSVRCRFVDASWSAYDLTVWKLVLENGQY
ncbi:MAG: hypothetical protein GXP38_01690 [Chloroflexi bacterium]|nr:hypothetical protein [Chloroflexota bacterium]